MTANASNKQTVRCLTLVLYPYVMEATYPEIDDVIEDYGIEVGQPGPVR